MRDIGKPFFDLAYLHLGNLVDWMESPKFQVLKRDLTVIMQQFMDIAKVKVERAISWIKSDEAMKFARYMKDTAIWLGSIATKSFSNVIAFTRSDNAKALAGAMMEVARWLGRIAEMSFDAFLKVTEWMSSDSAANIKMVAEKVLWLAKNFASLAAGAVVMREIIVLTMEFRTAFTAVSLAIAANPFGLLIDALALVAAGFIAARIEGKSFGDYLETLKDNITGVKGAVSVYGDQVSRQKDHSKSATVVDQAGQGEVTDQKVSSMKNEVETLKKREADLLKAAQDAYAKATRPDSQRGFGEKNNAAKAAEAQDADAKYLDYRATALLLQRAKEDLAARQAQNTALKTNAAHLAEQRKDAAFDVKFRAAAKAYAKAIEKAAEELPKKFSLFGTSFLTAAEKAENARITKGWGSAAKASKDAQEGKVTMFGDTIDDPTKKAARHSAPSSFHGIADFSKHIQRGLNKKDKEVAKNTKEIAHHAKALVDKANKKIQKDNKKGAAHHPPRMG
jgi:hypothetical protein